MPRQRMRLRQAQGMSSHLCAAEWVEGSWSQSPMHWGRSHPAVAFPPCLAESMVPSIHPHSCHLSPHYLLPRVAGAAEQYPGGCSPIGKSSALAGAGVIIRWECGMGYLGWEQAGLGPCRVLWQLHLHCTAQAGSAACTPCFPSLAGSWDLLYRVPPPHMCTSSLHIQNTQQ